MANIVDLLRYGLVTINARPAGHPDSGRVQKEAVKSSGASTRRTASR